MAGDQLFSPQPGRYHLIVLGLWLEHNEGAPVWRFSLEYPLTAERVGFLNLADLMAALERWMLDPSVLPGTPANNPQPTSVSATPPGGIAL